MLEQEVCNTGYNSVESKRKVPRGKYGTKREETTRGQNENITWSLTIYIFR
jgi:hypothetical protein